MYKDTNLILEYGNGIEGPQNARFYNLAKVLVLQGQHSGVSSGQKAGLWGVFFSFRRYAIVFRSV